ncbi:hypothetical protein MASR2M39_28820 [Ignavibacteriales bacterium]
MNFEMNISQFSPHIFWSYDKSKDLPEEVVIEQVLFNGEIEDFDLLFKSCSRESIEKVVVRYEKNGMREKRTNFIRKMYLS